MILDRLLTRGEDRLQSPGNEAWFLRILTCSKDFMWPASLHADETRVEFIAFLLVHLTTGIRDARIAHLFADR